MDLITLDTLPTFSSCTTAHCHRQTLDDGDEAIKLVVQRRKDPPETTAELAGRFWMQALLNYRLLPGVCEIGRILRVCYARATGEVLELPGDAAIPPGVEWREDHYQGPTQWTVPPWYKDGVPLNDRRHPVLPGPDEGPYLLIVSENGISCGCRRAHEAARDPDTGAEGPCTHKAALQIRWLLESVDRTVWVEDGPPPAESEIEAAYITLLGNLCVNTAAPPVPLTLLPSIGLHAGAAEQIYRVLWLLDRNTPIRLVVPDVPAAPDPTLGARLGAALAALTAEIAAELGPLGAQEIAVAVYGAEGATQSVQAAVNRIQAARAQRPAHDDLVDSVAGAIAAAKTDHAARAREAGETPYRTALRDVWGIE